VFSADLRSGRRRVCVTGRPLPPHSAAEDFFTPRGTLRARPDGYNLSREDRLGQRPQEPDMQPTEWPRCPRGKQEGADDDDDCAGDSCGRPGAAAGRLKRATDHVGAHPDQNLTLAQLSALVHIAGIISPDSSSTAEGCRAIASSCARASSARRDHWRRPTCPLGTSVGWSDSGVPATSQRCSVASRRHAPRASGEIPPVRPAQCGGSEQ